MDQFLKKVNSAIKFKQSTWLKSYISLISKYRAKLEIDFEKSQNKFFNNSVFDRKIQNDRKQRDVQLITNEKQKKRLASSGNFKGSKYVSDFP